MISIAKEKKIRRLLKKGFSYREIARKMKVSHGTVAVIKKSPTLRDRTKLPRKLPRELPKLKKPYRRCKTCGGKVNIWPCLKCHPEVGNYDELESTKRWRKIDMPPNEILFAEASELFHIVNEIQELYKLGLISHPLFRSLARRAKNSLKNISTKMGVSNGET